MRDWSVRLGFLFVILGTSCATAPPVSVVRRSPTDKPEEVRGDPMKLKRPDKEAFAGAKPGFHIIRTREDWLDAWPAGTAPDMPESVADLKRHMTFFVTAETKKIIDLKVTRALETAEFIYVYVEEQRKGQHCVTKQIDRTFDVVTTPRIDKPVKFFVDTAIGESCGDPPVATVQCRVATEQSWADKIKAQPGDAVECQMSANARGKFELIDKHVSIGDLPAGSSSKFKFKKGSERGSFEVDVYGVYGVKAEAVDEGGRHGIGVASVDVKPPTTKDVLVQLVWAGFDIKDVADSFPRVNLRVSEPGPKGNRCSADIPVPGLCEVKTRGSYTYMTIPAGSRRLPISVQYLEERAEKGPGPCVHVWYDGARTAELCDHGKREAEEIWRVGTVDTTTGKLEGGAEPEPPKVDPKVDPKKPAAPAPKT